MPGAGGLRDRVTFQTRQVTSDDYGNEVSGDWQDEFTVWANVRVAAGREEVLAQQLQGIFPVAMTVRYTSDTKRINESWRAVNANTDEEYNIRSARDLDGKHAWIAIVATLGGAT